MNLINSLVTVLFLAVVIGTLVFYLRASYRKDKEITLPAPNVDGGISVEKAIKSRRSVRSYKQEALSIAQVSQLLWAAQGVTSNDGLRSAPSAGALYPIEIYLVAGKVTDIVAGKVTDLAAGVYKYSNKNHALTKIVDGDKRVDLSDAALSQAWIKDAPAAIVVCGVYERTSKKYGQAAPKYVYMEVGCVAQNVYLQATSLGLGTTFVGAIDEEKVATILNSDKSEHALCILPVGIVSN
jgi:SagB-type dehydrogenase family enzyme